MNAEIRVHVRAASGKRKTLKCRKHCGKFIVRYQGLEITEEMLQGLKKLYEESIIRKRKQLAMQRQTALKVSKNTGKTPNKTTLELNK